MGDVVHQIVFAPDGRYIAACSFDKMISIWEARTGMPMTRLKGHTGSVWGVAFSPDGSQLASYAADRSVQIFDLDSWIAIGDPITGHTSSAKAVCYSPDGRFIAFRGLDAGAAV